ncbi:MAG: transposase [bacterium]|nr:hypothetical protein [Deltaproteobacteria bacterium]MCP4908099.1 transposase [bacterium]
MKRKRFTEEQTIGVLNKAEQTGNNREVYRLNNISEQTFYRWRTKFGGMDASEAKRLRGVRGREHGAQEDGCRSALELRRGFSLGRRTGRNLEHVRVRSLVPHPTPYRHEYAGRPRRDRPGVAGRRPRAQRTGTGLSHANESGAEHARRPGPDPASRRA